MLIIILAGESHKDPAANNFILQCMKKFPKNMLGYLLEAPNDMPPKEFLNLHLHQDIINKKLEDLSDKERSFFDYDKDFFDRRFQIRALNQTLSFIIEQEIPYHGIELSAVISQYIINLQHQVSKNEYLDLKALRNKFHLESLSKILIPYLNKSGILIVNQGADHIDHTQAAIKEIFRKNNCSDYKILPCFIYSSYTSEHMVEHITSDNSLKCYKTHETKTQSCSFDHSILLDEIELLIKPTNQFESKSKKNSTDINQLNVRVSNITFLNDHEQGYLDLLNWLKQNSFHSKITSAIHDKNLELAFRLAAAGGHLELMKKIIFFVSTSKEFENFNINATSSNGYTALDWAQEKISDVNLRLQVVEFLNKHDAFSKSNSLKQTR